MIERTIKDSILSLSKEYPVILVQGPRQSGKTTLVKTLFPEKKYITLEDIDTRSRAIEDPRGFLSNIPDGAILDEVQRAPDILSYIQSIVDSNNKMGMFILTGSSNLLLMEAVSQSLSGRVAIFKLLPLSMLEVKDIEIGWSIEKRILNGFYPRLLTQKMDVSAFFRNYIETYVERDVRRVLNIRNIDSFRRFLVCVAQRIGSTLDITSLASDAMVSTKTVSEWLSILDASFICFRLQPYFSNRSKRLAKRPKIYFYDTGLACALLGIVDEEQLSNDRLRGSLFENMLIVDMLKRKYNKYTSEEFYFYRTLDGVEVDLVMEKGRKLYPMEIKSSQTFNPDWASSLCKFEAEYSDECEKALIIYGGNESFKFKNINVFGYLDTIS